MGTCVSVFKIFSHETCSLPHLSSRDLTMYFFNAPLNQVKDCRFGVDNNASSGSLYIILFSKALVNGYLSRNNVMIRG